MHDTFDDDDDDAMMRDSFSVGEGWDGGEHASDGDLNRGDRLFREDVFESGKSPHHT
jgi:hypothetical protein